MAAEASSSSSADSYIGSLISLTSKSEIRYEGVLYNINTVESSIGLRNVRSFGTEGRKKDGPQVPASDKIYEYILFRGSDIKDLQVKASPPVQHTPTINNDPAIIQSHYPLVASTSISLPTVTESLPNNGSHSVQVPHLGSTFPSNLPLYQPGGNTGSWALSQPLLNANASGIALPMYWPGYYGLPNAHPSITQSLLRPPPGLSLPPSIQQHQYPGLSGSFPGASALTGANVSEYPTIFPSSANSLDLSSISLPSSHHPSSITPFPTATLSSDTLPSLIPNRVPNSALPASSLGTNFLSFPALASSSQDANIGSLPTSSKLNAVPAIPSPYQSLPPLSKPNAVPAISLPYQALPQAMSLVSGTSVSNHVENPAPSLVTPGQLLQSFPATVPSTQSLHSGHKDAEVVGVPSTSSVQASASKSTQLSSSTSGKQASSTREAQPPILPLPVPSRPGQKFNGVQYHGRNNYRGRERGRESMNPRATAKFAEDFDFTAMNEKFNKDEVWGHLGKSSRSHSRAKEEDGNVEDEDEYEDGDNYLLPNIDSRPTYNKDDFFDTISCNSLDHESHSGRTRFSEQMKIDAETFGEFPRYRGGRGGWGHRGGGRSRGGYYGRGYGSFGRGRGRRGQ